MRYSWSPQIDNRLYRHMPGSAVQHKSITLDKFIVIISECTWKELAYINKWSKNSDEALQRHFSVGKFNVILDCFCGRGQSERWLTACGKFLTSEPLRMVLGDMWENPDIMPLKSAPSHEGSCHHLIHSLLGLPKSTLQMAPDWFSHFCRAHSCYRHTN